jgi:hypothetical protein
LNSSILNRGKEGAVMDRAFIHAAGIVAHAPLRHCWEQLRPDEGWSCSHASSMGHHTPSTALATHSTPLHSLCKQVLSPLHSMQADALVPPSSGTVTWSIRAVRSLPSPSPQPHLVHQGETHGQVIHAAHTVGVISPKHLHGQLCRQTTARGLDLSAIQYVPLTHRQHQA